MSFDMYDDWVGSGSTGMSQEDAALEQFDKVLTRQLQARVKDMTTSQFKEPRFADWQAPYCYDCGDEIPVARLNMGRVRCVDCQQLAEKMGDE